MACSSFRIAARRATLGGFPRPGARHGRIAATGCSGRRRRRHPELARSRALPMALTGALADRLAGVPEPWHDADIGGERIGASKRAGLPSSAIMRAEVCGPTPSMVVSSLPMSCSPAALRCRAHFGEAASPEVEVLTDVAHLNRSRSMMRADRAFCGLDKPTGQLGADGVAAVVAQLGHAARRGSSEGLRGWVSARRRLRAGCRGFGHSG